MSVLRLVRLALLFVSFAGYIIQVSRKIKPDFAVGVVFSSVGCAMFVAGMLGVLAPAAYAIALCGILLAVISLKDLKSSLSRIITPGTVFFAVLCAVLLFVLKGSMFVGTDAFSHWATVEKLLLRYDRFPVQGDNYILFQSYPLGSASFMYYFCKVVGGDSEWLQIFAHAILEAAMVVSIFGFVRKDNRKTYIVHNICAALAAVMLLCSQVIFTSLCVDALLSAIAFSGMALCIYYKDSLAEKLWFAVPHMVFLMAVKNSGLLFSAVIALYIIFYISKSKKSVGCWAVCAAAPFAVFWLWRKHVEHTFADGLNSLHAMSKEHYDIMYEEKVNSNIVGEICSLFGKEVFSPANVAIYIFLMALITIAICRFAFGKPVKSLVQLTVFSFIVYAAYQAGTLAMYLFSMPSYEALVLPSYPRYHMTVIAFIAGILICEIWQTLYAKSEKSNLPAAVLAMLCACTLALWGCVRPDISFFARQNPDDVSSRAAFGSFVQQYQVPEGSSYLVVDSDENPTLTPYHINYYLMPEHSRLWSLALLKEYSQFISEYEYLIIYDDSTDAMEYVEEIFGENMSRVIHVPSSLSVQNNPA